MAEPVQSSWLRCAACKDGRIVLLTSIVRCAECLGTGINLKDPGLGKPLADFEMSVRARKYLRANDVVTLLNLLAFARHGLFDVLLADNQSVVMEIQALLRHAGLPTGPIHTTS